jgi:UDP-4-amino-4,6-dideoxy-N-acetyl-beta-L-altrosamine N-acetyltransferase
MHNEAAIPYALRPLQMGDAEWLRHARNSDEVRPFMLSQKIITIEEHQRWLEKRISHHAQTPYFMFLCQEKPLGVVGISAMDEATGRGEWGFYIYADRTPSGAGTRMLSAFLDEMLLRRGLPGMSAHVLASNERSLHLHRRLGFSEESASDDVVALLLPGQQWKEQRPAFAGYIEQVEIREQ